MIHYYIKGNIYKRFIRVPIWLARATVCVIWLNVIGLVVISTPDGFSGLAICFLVSFVLTLLLGIVYQIIKMTLMRERLRRWAGSKFASWKEFNTWIFDTPSEELDRLAGLKDDSWIPAITNKDHESSDL